MQFKSNKLNKNYTSMIASLQSHNSANVSYKKSLSKNSSIHNHYNFKGGGTQKSTHSKPRIASNKFFNQVPHDQHKEKAVLNFQNKLNQVGPTQTKAIKSRSCQNSTEKISASKVGMKTLYVGSSTQRNHNSTTIKMAKKQLQRHEFEFIGTQTRAPRQKNFFYEGNKTQKINELRWTSKQFMPNKKQPTQNQRQKSLNSRQKHPVTLQQQKWTESNTPYKWKQVLQKFSHFLTRYQQQQIKEYKNVYYIGHKLSRLEKQKIYTKGRNSPSKQLGEQITFDNNGNEYIYQTHDHIAYRYEILQKMGKGSYGQVVKVFDHKKKQNLALKIVRNKTKFNQQAFTQIQLLTHIKQKDVDNCSNIVKIKDFIIFRKHVCIVFELLSQNLYELITRNNYNGLSPELIRRFAIQVLTALQFMKQENIIHCDLKPENILLREFNKSGIKIIDLGSSCFKNETRYTYIQSRYYRAPQITMGIKYSHQIDIWSVGCIFGELFTGIPLFPGENQNQQMKYFVKTLGLPPHQIAIKGERCELFFDANGQPLEAITNAKSIDHFELSLKDRMNEPDFCHFIEGFLKWDPKQRWTPVQALNHKWIRQGLPPQISRILPGEKVEKKSQSRSQSRKTQIRSQQRHTQNERTPQKSQHDVSSIRIKKSSKLLSQKSRELKNRKE